jgi:hypothetical protein
MSAHSSSHHWRKSRWEGLPPVALCIVAAVSATLLSGFEDPKLHNYWNMLAALDFARSAEGPHDAYNRTYWHFISIYWLLVKAIATDQNVAKIFIVLQLIGNSLLSLAFYSWTRALTGRRWAAAIAAAGFCFCYGLWSKTQLGYSEMFLPYATHSQAAIVVCLFGLLLLIHDRYIWAAVMLGVAAEINLYMAAWTALAAGGYLVFEERRLITKLQIGFAVVLLVLTAPVLVWALLGRTGPKIPAEFFQENLAGHTYGFNYPQAVVQTFALCLSAAAATIGSAAGENRVRRLGVVMLCCVASLAAGMTMPYFTSEPLLLSLHPLRFVSVANLLAAICAGVLLVRRLDALEDDGGMGALLAAVGFMMKSPLVSMLGFALSVPYSKPGLRLLCTALLMAGILGVLLPSPMIESSTKSVLAFILVCAMLALARWLYSAAGALESDRFLGVGVGALGAIGAVPPSGYSSIAALLSIPTAVVLAVPAISDIWRRLASAAAVGGVGVILLSVSNDPMRLLLVAIGSAIAFGSVLAFRVRLARVSGSARGAILASPIILLIGLGVAKGAANHFSVTRTTDEQEYIVAQIWARAHTAPDTVFYAPNHDAFSLYSRRPVWGEPSETAAVMWEPSYYPLWRCRSAAARAADSVETTITLALSANIEYLVLPAEEKTISNGSFERVYRNGHYVILQRIAAKVSDPLCPEK